MLFQWKWLNAHPWLLVYLVRKDTTEPLIIDKPYPHKQPRHKIMQPMSCSMCSKHPSVASKDSKIPKRSGTKNFKIDALMRRVRVTKNVLKRKRRLTIHAKTTEMYKCCKQLYEEDDEKMEKKFKTAFHIASLERPLDDYKSLCALQKLNGVELGETDLLSSICMYGIY